MGLWLQQGWDGLPRAALAPASEHRQPVRRLYREGPPATCALGTGPPRSLCVSLAPLDSGPYRGPTGAPRPPRRPAAPASAGLLPTSPQAPGPTATTGGPRRSGSARRVLNMPNQRGGLGLPEEAVQARWERPGRRVATAPLPPAGPAWL